MKLLRPGIVAGMFTLSVLAVVAPVTQVTSAATPPDMAAMPILAQAQATDALPANPGCSPDVVPVGQANPPGSQLEPLRPIWCFNLAQQGAPTRVSGTNDWVDTFQGVTPMGQFNDGDLDYRVFDNVGNTGARTQHFTNNNHWMDDNAGNNTGGTMLRPNRSFRFENGKLIVEADVAAGITGYIGPDGGDRAWPEIDISTADSPLGHTVVDNLYSYGRFGGFDTVGCRINSGGDPICSYEAARAGAGPEVPPCFEGTPARLFEISWFENCGNVHTGGERYGDNAAHWRQCSSPAQTPDMMCRDRFRMELSQNGLRFFVNGLLYFEDSGWPARNQLPAAIADGSTPVYVYMSDWQDVPDQPAYRFHWARFAVNPHNPDGSILAPSAAPTFCLGQPNSTCMAGTPTNTPVSNPPATNTPVPPASTATPVPATRTPIPATSTPGSRSITLQRGQSVRITCNGGTLGGLQQSASSATVTCN